MEIICSKTYFSQSYKLFKIKVTKITQQWDRTKYFLYNNPLVMKSQI